MASASFGMLSLLIAILSGGATDMLDFVASDAYWKAKNVTVSVDQLLAEIKPVEGADISAHIRALGAGTDAQRQAASEKILAHGRAALPPLERAADDPDPEVASRINTLIQRIQTASKSSSVRRLVAIRTLGEMRLHPWKGWYQEAPPEGGVHVTRPPAGGGHVGKAPSGPR